LVIEGFKEFEAIRDFLYTRMRGYQTHTAVTKAESPASAATVSGAAGEQEALSLLTGIRNELRRTRELLESQASRTSGGATRDSANPRP
jgi:hypothetical protein